MVGLTQSWGVLGVGEEVKDKGIDLFFLFLWKGLLMRQGHFPLASDGVEVGWGAEAEQAGGQVSLQ